MTIWSKLFVWHTSRTSEFILMSQGANCKSGKPYGLIFIFPFLNSGDGSWELGSDISGIGVLWASLGLGILYSKA